MCYLHEYNYVIRNSKKQMQKPPLIASQLFFHHVFITLYNNEKSEPFALIPILLSLLRYRV